MKNVRKTILLILVLTIAGSSTIFAQRGERGMRGMRPDSVIRSGDRMMKMRMHPDSVYQGMTRDHMRQMMRMHDDRRFGPMSQMRHGYGRGPRSGWGPDTSFRGGFGRFDRPGRFESIPNLTDKQKKDIADLRQKQMDEMKKFREESQTKMKEMRESFRNKVRDQLTDEQKKYLDDNSPEQSSGKK